MAPEKGEGWMRSFSRVSSPMFFLLLLLQIPLFRVPCRFGMCLTPIHVISSQLIAREIIPVPIVKTLLYPRAIAGGLITQKKVPSWDDLLDIYKRSLGGG